MTMTEDFVIREYRNSDHAQVAALNAYGLAAAGVPADADVYAGDLDDINATYLTSRGTLLVGQLGDDVVAMGALREIDPTTCEITRMRVAPHVQGRGYGKAMLARLEEIARSHGYRRATLLTGPDQRPAIDLYAAANYTVVGTERHDMLVGVRMSKQLEELLGPSRAASIREGKGRG